MEGPETCHAAPGSQKDLWNERGTEETVNSVVRVETAPHTVKAEPLVMALVASRDWRLEK